MSVANNYVPIPAHPMVTTAPYTYREGMTFIQVIEEMRRYLNVLIESDTAQALAYADLIEDANTSIQSALTNLVDLETAYSSDLESMRMALADQLASVNASLVNISAAITAAESANATATGLAASFNNAVQGFNDDMQVLVEQIEATAVASDERTDNLLLGYVKENTLTINVKDHGAIGDGLTDDAPAIRAAILAGGFGAEIFLPRGTYLANSGFTLMANQTLMGESMNRRGLSNGSSKDEGSRIVTGTTFSGVLVTCEGGVNIEKVRFDGPGHTTSATAISQITGSSFNMRDVFIRKFATGVYVKDGYYVNLDHYSIWECQTAVDLEHCYNVSAFNTRISAIKGDGTVGVGIRMSNQTELHMFGGAVEGYSVGINVDGANQLLDMNGVYFEQGVADAYSRGVSVNGAGNVVNAHGCVAWLNNHRAWIHFPTTAGARLNASGNLFKWTGDPSTIGIYAYEWLNPNTGGLRVILQGDSWERIPKVAALKYSPSTLPGQSMVIPPYGAYRDGGVTDEVALSSMRTAQVGTATWTQVGRNEGMALPSMPRGTEWAGALVWMVGSNKLACWNGTAWVDAMGDVL